MNQTGMPFPRYVRVIDHLEQASAVLPRDAYADPLRELIGEAVDLALELSYQRTPDCQVPHFQPLDQATDAPKE
ncbi:MAG TPA: hypothetical protein VL147_16110 [Devosia sp.]|nr:hypothetical protein [Devosia sp.]